MNYRRLGRTNLDVSEISLGTVELGLDYGLSGRPSEREAQRLLARAIELGINFFDTARLYGESEAILGRAFGGCRESVWIVSKVPSFENEGLRGAALRERVKQSVSESLRALRMEALDILMIHSASMEVLARGEVLAAMQELRRSGCVRYLGASVYSEEAAMAAIRTGGYDCLQIAYSLLDRRPERYLAAADVGIIARSVLLKGALTWRYASLPEELSSLKAAVERLARAAGTTAAGLPELAYRYVLGQPWVHTALMGASSGEELEAAVRYASAGPLPADLLERLRHTDLDDDTLLNPSRWPPLRPSPGSA
jgi:aryl-alcohol dehydrogenase-like predicted oxidoreductase